MVEEIERLRLSQGDDDDSKPKKSAKDQLGANAIFFLCPCVHFVSNE